MCNTDGLAFLERYVDRLLMTTYVANTFFSKQELERIIRWFEIIEYKFQILNLIRRFVASKQQGYNKFLSDFPMSMLRHKPDTYSKVVAEVRRSQRRITVLSK